MDITIDIARDFSREPGARYPEEGLKSGEEFRKEILAPKIKKAIAEKGTLTVVLDGTAGLGTSFLEESFGGLIRKDGLKYKDILNSLKLISNEAPHYKDEVYSYLKNAHEKEGH